MDGYDTDDTDEIYRRKGVAPGLAVSRDSSPMRETFTSSAHLDDGLPAIVVSDDWLFTISRPSQTIGSDSDCQGTARHCSSTALTNCF